MKNRDIYQRDPSKIILLNNGVATMTDALTDDERRTLRFELEHFVCEGEYQLGLVRILDSYTPRSRGSERFGRVRQRDESPRATSASNRGYPTHSTSSVNTRSRPSPTSRWAPG